MLTRAIEPKNVIELGTNVGISSAYIGSALQVNGMDGKLTTPDAVFVFDDIRWSDGMKKAWDELTEDIRLGLIVDFYRFGLCVRTIEGIKKRYIFPPLKLK